jgi:hypothetical protein
VNDGATQSFTITAAAHYRILDVKVDGVSVGALASYTFKNVTADHTIVASFVIVNPPPDCRLAVAVPAQLWPPNHRLVPIKITGVTGASGNSVRVTVTGITQDEPLSDGKSCDAAIENGDARVRAERSGGGNGRVYTISFRADDGHGGQCDGRVTVCVPHDQGGKKPASSKHGKDSDHDRNAGCSDDGLAINSLGPCRTNGKDRGEKPDALTEVTLTPRTSNGNAATLEYELPTASDVRIAVYDVAGRRVATLEDGPQSAGAHSVSWDSSSLARGLYFYRLQTRETLVTKSVLILK